MSEERIDAQPLTSVELLDAAVWREIGSEEAQPASTFLAALSRLVEPARELYGKSAAVSGLGINYKIGQQASGRPAPRLADWVYPFLTEVLDHAAGWGRRKRRF